MKSLIIAMLVGLMMVGCGEEAKKEAVQEEAKDDDAIRAELERERVEEERRLAPIKAKEDAIKAKEKRRLAAIRAEEERKKLQELITKRVKLLIEKRKNFITDNKLEMLWVKHGAFIMGVKGFQQQVTLTKGFYLGKYEVTQAQWERVMGNNPSAFKGADRPVEKVSWNAAVEFCKKLTKMEKNAGRVPQGMSYQLPTEAQWEYACRAGTTTKYSWGDDINPKLANYTDSGLKTMAVGSYRPNPWGFYDMHGNVWEWCADWFGGLPSRTDPIGPASGSIRIKRGGSWFNAGSSMRSARPSTSHPQQRHGFIGFRVGFQSSK